MPMYDYEAKDEAGACEHCRAGFEVLHPIAEKGPKKCPECGVPVKRAISAPNVSAGQWSSKRLLAKDNLLKHGFQTGAQFLESNEPPKLDR
jgi:putative FmdB family regulatory protein